VCYWTDQLPEDCQDNADGILIEAARMGMDLRDLAALAAEIQARANPGTGNDDDAGQVFDDRAVRLETTFGGAGVMAGDLTPECAAAVRTVLDALSAPRGAEDTRSQQQRYHDALEDAMRRLVSADLLPERAGQPAKVLALVIQRDQHCRFPGGCDQPAAGCEVHHTTHQANGGKTSVSDCALYCFFHHHVVIHQWGWTVVLNPDGTTTAYSPDKTKILHSHGPPPAAPGVTPHQRLGNGAVRPRC
jgi:hypothetical protein